MKQVVDTVTLCRLKLVMKGYAFCKLIPVNSISEKFNYLVQVYDYFIKDKNVARNFATKILEHDYLFDRVPIKLPSMERGAGAWKHINILPNENISFPAYKFIPSTLCRTNHISKNGIHSVLSRTIRYLYYIMNLLGI